MGIGPLLPEGALHAQLGGGTLEAQAVDQGAAQQRRQNVGQQGHVSQRCAQLLHTHDPLDTLRMALVHGRASNSCTLSKRPVRQQPACRKTANKPTCWLVPEGMTKDDGSWHPRMVTVGEAARSGLGGGALPRSPERPLEGRPLVPGLRGKMSSRTLTLQTNQSRAESFSVKEKDSYKFVWEAGVHLRTCATHGVTHCLRSSALTLSRMM